MQRSVELSLYSLRQGVLEFINMHKSLSQMFIVKNPGGSSEVFIRLCLEFSELVEDKDFKKMFFPF